MPPFSSTCLFLVFVFVLFCCEACRDLALKKEGEQLAFKRPMFRKKDCEEVELHSQDHKKTG